jgi:hypothetical protein
MKRKLKVLIACEESQRVCIEFRRLGHEAYSCDVQEPSGGHPAWHILGDVLEVLNPDTENGCIVFDTMNGQSHMVHKWDLIVAHPPCTYLTNVATRHHSLKFTPLDKINARTMNRIESMEFFMHFVNANSDHIAIENPVGVMNTCYRKPDMIIHPYMFAESVDDTENYHTKATCLWTKGLPNLVGTGLPKPDNEKLYGRNPSGKVSNWEERQIGGKDRAKNRSKTFPGIAKAIAEQWSAYLEGLEE